MSNLDVSIVMPVFEGARFLRHSVGSCLRELDAGLTGEVVAVDDGSGDGSCDLLRTFGSRVRTVPATPARSGRNQARNQGLALALGRYVKFLDQDDDLWPGALREEVVLADAQAADIVVSACRLAPFDGREDEGQLIPAPQLDRGIDSLLAGESALTAAALYRRTHLAGCQWEETAGKFDDWRFFVSVALRGGRIARRAEVSYTWRQHADQCSLRYDLLANARAFYEMLDWLEAELRQRGELSAPRRRRLAQYRYKELGILGRFDRAAFEREFARIFELDTSFQPRDEESRGWMRLAARILGPRAAMNTYLALRRLLKGADSPARAGTP